MPVDKAQQELSTAVDRLLAILQPYRSKTLEVNQLVQELLWLKANIGSPRLFSRPWDLWLFRSVRDRSLNGIPQANDYAIQLVRLLHALNDARLKHEASKSGSAVHVGNELDGASRRADASKGSLVPESALEASSDQSSNRLTEPSYKLCLFVAGTTRPNQRAIENIEVIARSLHDCTYDIVDILKQPDLAESERIIATPTLVRHHPLPKRKIIGDLSDTQTVLLILAA